MATAAEPTSGRRLDSPPAGASLAHPPAEEKAAREEGAEDDVVGVAPAVMELLPTRSEGQTDAGDREAPKRAAGDAEDGEAPQAHAGDAGRDGDEGTHDGEDTPDEYERVAIAPEPRLGLVEPLGTHV